jgi:predicted ATPase
MSVATNIDRFFVLTGGPGSGKTTLIEALEQAGYARSVEAGRGVIQDQVAIGGHALPWRDPVTFAELMLAWEIRSYHMAQGQAGPVFFDRGVPDVVGYLRLIGLPVPQHMEKAAEAFRYNRRVFIAPLWPEIFGQDSERMQSLEEAVRTYEAMVGTYSGYGYELVEIPRATVKERVHFVIESAGIAGPA